MMYHGAVLTFFPPLSFNTCGYEKKKLLMMTTEILDLTFLLVFLYFLIPPSFPPPAPHPNEGLEGGFKTWFLPFFFPHFSPMSYPLASLPAYRQKKFQYTGGVCGAHVCACIIGAFIFVFLIFFFLFFPFPSSISLYLNACVLSNGILLCFPLIVHVVTLKTYAPEIALLHWPVVC